MNNTQIRPQCILEKDLCLQFSVVCQSCCTPVVSVWTCYKKKCARRYYTFFFRSNSGIRSSKKLPLYELRGAWFLKENKLKLFWDKMMFPLFSKKEKFLLEKFNALRGFDLKFRATIFLASESQTHVSRLLCDVL